MHILREFKLFANFSNTFNFKTFFFFAETSGDKTIYGVDGMGRKIRGAGGARGKEKRVKGEKGKNEKGMKGKKGEKEKGRRGNGGKGEKNELMMG